MLDSLQKIQPKILVIGDLMIDQYLWGACERISPEGPVQIIDINSETSVLGGAGNVANNLLNFNSKVDVCSVIGNCQNSIELLQLFKTTGLSAKYLIREKTRVTSKKTRIIASHQQVIRFDMETNIDISLESEKKLIDIVEKIIKDYQIIILSDYGKGVLTNQICRKIIDLANNLKIKVLVDPKGNDFSKYHSAYLLTPNKKEAIAATQIEINDDNSLLTALRALKEKCNLGISLITLSEDGVAVYDETLRIHPTYARDVYDVTGAGDTVIAALALSLAKNVDIDNAVKFANLAAGVVVGKIGSATTTLDEIVEYESSLHLAGPEEHIKNSNQIEVIVKNLKSKNKKIVFTNGCFDILHAGHVKYLTEARSLGDILIVGINSDESVKRLKGPSRPINTLKDRSIVIAGLDVVDYVVPFSEDTPTNLIKKIRPKFLVKGSDYKGKEVAGKEYADELILIEFVNGKSTSNLIRKIKNQAFD